MVALLIDWLQHLRSHGELMRALALVLLFIPSVLLTAPKSFAQPNDQAVEQSDSGEESLGESVWRDATSPFTTKARNVLISGAAASLLLAILEDNIDDPIQEHAIRTRPMGNFATDAGVLAGNFVPNAAYSIGMLSYGWLAENDRARDRGNLMFRASLYAQTMTTALKHIVREPRPDGSKQRVSFPSGHATSAFSFASVVGVEHPWYVGLAAYTYATIVAYGRINDNRHYFHDVIGGAAVGASYGIALYLRKEQKAKRGKLARRSTQLVPTANLDGAMVFYSADF